MGVEWDKGNWPKCGEHGVSQAEIECVLNSAETMVGPDPFAEETRFRAVGPNADGRYVFLVFTWRGDDMRPITARYMHEKEIKHYEEARGAKKIPSVPK
jgi:uncharacterized DUF497 family protein